MYVYAIVLGDNVEKELEKLRNFGKTEATEAESEFLLYTEKSDLTTKELNEIGIAAVACSRIR